MKNKFFSTKALCISGVIAAVYAALTYFLAPISYGAVQCRISEALTILPILIPEAIPGLFVGCLLANILGGCTLLDIVFGSLTTLVAAILTYKLRKNVYIAALPPVLLNGLVVGTILHFVENLPWGWTMLYVAIGEAAAVYIIGLLLIGGLKKIPAIQKLES